MKQEAGRHEDQLQMHSLMFVSDADSLAAQGDDVAACVLST